MKNFYQRIYLAIVAISVLSAGVANAQLSGTYTVGGTTPDYTSIQMACDSLETHGISGPVTIDIRTGVYTENVVLGTVAGVSASNTITFQSEAMDADSVTIEDLVPNSPFECGSPYVNFHGLTFDYGFATYYGLYVNSVSNVNVTNCHFEVVGSAGLYAEYPTGTGSMISDIMVDSCTFNTMYGIGVVADNVSNVTITNSAVNGPTNSAFYIAGEDLVSGVTTMNNYIDCDQLGIEIYSDLSIEDVSCTGDTIMSASGDAIYVEVNVLNMANVAFDGVYTQAPGYGIYVYADLDLDNVTLTNCTVDTTATTNNQDAVYIAGYDGKLSNITVSDCDITASVASEGTALHLESEEWIENVEFTNNTVYSGGSYAIDVEGGSYAVVDQVHFEDNHVTAAYDDYTIRVYSSDYTVDNVSFMRDTVINTGSNYAVRIDGEHAIRHVNIDSAYFMSDTLAGSRAFDFYTSDGHFEDVTITNSYFHGYSGGLELEGNTTFFDVLLENCTIIAHDGNALNFDVDDNKMDGVDVNNCTMIYRGGTGRALNVRTGDGDIDNFHMFGCTMIGNVRMDPSGGFHNFSMRNCDILATSGDINLEADENGYDNFILDSLYVTGTGRLVFIDPNYMDGTDVYITNSTFIKLDSLTSGSRVMELEADYGRWINLVVENNLFVGGGGLEVEQDYGYFDGVYIRNNEFRYGNRLFYMDGIGDNFYFTDNIATCIDPAGSALTVIEIRGTEGVNNGTPLNFERNHFSGINSKAVYVDGGRNYVFRDNVWDMNDAFTGNSAIEFDGVSGTLEFTNNMIIGENDDEGVYFNDCHFVAERALFANNFITGFDNSLDIYETSGLNIYHNSFSSDDNTTMIEIDYARDMHINNNIFSSDNGNTMFSITNDVYNTDINYNVYNITTGSFAVGDYPATDFTDWQTTHPWDQNSFEADPMFADPDADLHVDCSSTALNAGRPLTAAPAYDIDGNSRDNLAFNATIGADEVLAPGENPIANNDVTICGDTPRMLSAGSGYGNVEWAWSTGDSTETIWIDAPGTYSVTITDDCGSYSGSFNVAYGSMATANADATTSFLTAVFNNMSSGADSYHWNFGDGNTSTDENPVHIYDYPGGSYTVTLTAMDDCGSSVYQFTVDATITGMEEMEAGEGLVNLYPNPTRGEVSLSFGEFAAERVAVRIVDVSGKEVYQQQLNNVSAGYIHNVDLTGLSTGMYMVNIVADDKVTVLRLMKN